MDVNDLFSKKSFFEICESKTLIFLGRYPLELHMVHRNIHDEEVSEALEHENGLTVLGFKFEVDNLDIVLLYKMKNEIVWYQSGCVR